MRLMVSRESLRRVLQSTERLLTCRALVCVPEWGAEVHL